MFLYKIDCVAWLQNELRTQQRLVLIALCPEKSKANKKH